MLNYYSLYLYKDTTKKLVSTVAPALEDYETITYVSSNPDIVEVTSDGTLIYKSDGDATITVSVPACDGGDDVTATCTVYARQTTYSIRLHAGDNVTLSSSEYTLSSGVYIGSYTYGTTYYLPIAASMTKANEEYYFDGWYDNAGFTGSKIKDYIYFKLRLRQQGSITPSGSNAEAGYETSENTWVYGTFLTALSNVYNGGTIKLFKDVTYSGLLSISKNITLKTDGNPRTLTINDYINVTDGSLTIDSADLTITGGNNSYQLIYNGSNGTVNIKSGTVSSVSAYCIYNLGTLNILSGEIMRLFRRRHSNKQ